jgi:hypothetical protein
MRDFWIVFQQWSGYGCRKIAIALINLIDS